MGKSILGMNIARAAAEQGHGVLFVTLEMRDTQLAMRLAADLCFDGHSGVNFSDIERGEVSAEQFARVHRAKEEIHDLPLIIADLPSIRIGALNALIRRNARQMAARNIKLELVIVDYLQLVDPDRQCDNRTAEITQVSRGLKMAAKANDVGVIALAQLSRKVEEREERRPRLADLRESGSIEQDADGVLFLYRPEYYLHQNEPPEGHERREKWEAGLRACAGDIELICAKRRQGETGIKHARFFGAFQTVRG
jgi:replicative DNA helicase